MEAGTTNTCPVCWQDPLVTYRRQCDACLSYRKWQRYAPDRNTGTMLHWIEHRATRTSRERFWPYFHGGAPYVHVCVSCKTDLPDDYRQILCRACHNKRAYRIRKNKCTCLMHGCTRRRVATAAERAHVEALARKKCSGREVGPGEEEEGEEEGGGGEEGDTPTGEEAGTPSPTDHDAEDAFDEKEAYDEVTVEDEGTRISLTPPRKRIRAAGMQEEAAPRRQAPVTMTGATSTTTGASSTTTGASSTTTGASSSNPPLFIGLLGRAADAAAVIINAYSTTYASTYSLRGPIQEMVSALTGTPVEEQHATGEYYRVPATADFPESLAAYHQYLDTLLRDHLYSDIWVRAFMARYRAQAGERPHCVITDINTRDEAAALRAHGAVIVWVSTADGETCAPDYADESITVPHATGNNTLTQLQEAVLAWMQRCGIYQE